MKKSIGAILVENKFIEKIPAKYEEDKMTCAERHIREITFRIDANRSAWQVDSEMKEVTTFIINHDKDYNPKTI